MLQVSPPEECTLEVLCKAVSPLIGLYLTIVSTYFTFEDVKVPVENLIGKENEGMKVFMTSTSSHKLANSIDFNHERLGIAMYEFHLNDIDISQSLRMSRVCLEDTIRHTCKRVVYGKPLIEQPVVRFKLANVAYIPFPTQLIPGA
jgi:alkylation response protein AidB-like acyl-CoA dehydrogenase